MVILVIDDCNGTIDHVQEATIFLINLNVWKWCKLCNIMEKEEGQQWKFMMIFYGLETEFVEINFCSLPM